VRTTSAKAKPSSPLLPVIAATKKLWHQYHPTDDQTHYAAKEVRRALPIERPNTRKIEQIQNFLGHWKLETTQIYAESSPEIIKESHQRALAG
jgi:hypothetical protein